MVNIKEMPAKEKYENAKWVLKLASFKPEFIEKHLGKEARAEYEKEDQRGLKPVPEDATYEQKYEIIFNYMIWGGFSFGFVKQRMGEDGLKQFIRINVDLLKKENATLAMFLLKLIRAVSPRLAFNMTVKKIAHQFQFFSPYTVSELSQSKMVMETQHCKSLDYPRAEEYCSFVCQKVMPLWFAEQFKIEYKPNREDYACTITVTPIK